MATAGSVTIDFAAETAKFRTEVKAVRNELKTLQSQVGSVGQQLSKAGESVKAFVAGFAAFEVIKGAFHEVVAATSESEAAVAQLESALKSAGQSVATQSPRFQQFATDMQAVSTFGDEAVIGVENLLLSFKGLSGDTVLKATSAVLDISTRLGIDLRSAAIAVGRALQDPVDGLGALQRAGIKVDDSQKDFIKTLVNTGRTAEAQGLVFKELEARFGGAAAAARDNFAGALAGLKNALGDLLEVKGGLPATVANLNELSRVVQDPAVKAGADALFGSLIKGASAAAEFVAKLAGGIVVLAGKGDNEIVNLDLQIDALRAKRDAINAGHIRLAGPEAKRELEDLNTQIDDLLRKQRQMLETGEFSGNVLLNPQAVTAQRLDLPIDKAFNYENELKLIELRQKAIDNGLQSSFAILDQLVEKQKPIQAAFDERLKNFADQQLGALVAQVDRQIELDRQRTADALRNAKERAEAEERYQRDTRDAYELTALSAVGTFAFIAAGHGKTSKAIAAVEKAQALVAIWRNTYQGASLALAHIPYPFGFAAAASVIAFGAIQATNVLSEKTGGGGGSPSGASYASAAPPSVAPEQSVTPETQTATNVYINGYISKDVVDDLVDGLEDRFRNGTVVIRGGSNQANEIRRGL